MIWEPAPLEAPKMPKNSENDHIKVFALLTQKKVVMKQFFEAGWHLRGSWDKSSSIAKKFGYPRDLGGKKMAQKRPKI